MVIGVALGSLLLGGGMFLLLLVGVGVGAWFMLTPVEPPMVVDYEHPTHAPAIVDEAEYAAEVERLLAIEAGALAVEMEGLDGDTDTDTAAAQAEGVVAVRTSTRPSSRSSTASTLDDWEPPEAEPVPVEEDPEELDDLLMDLERAPVGIIDEEVDESRRERRERRRRDRD